MKLEIIFSKIKIKIKNISLFFLFLVIIPTYLFADNINMPLNKFESEVKNIVIRSILQKDFYLTKVISFKKIEDFSGPIEWINEEESLADSGYLDPYRLIFKLTINKLYIKKFEDLLYKVSKNIITNPDNIPRYSIVISDNPFDRWYDLRKFSYTKKVFQLNKKYFLRFKNIIKNFYNHYKARLRIAFLDGKGYLFKEVYYEDFYPYYSKSDFKDNKECEISRSNIQIILPNGKIQNIDYYNDNWFFADIFGDYITFYSKNPFLLSVVFYLDNNDLKYIKYIKIEVQWVKVK